MKAYCDCKSKIPGSYKETTVNNEEICTNCGYYAIMGEIYINQSEQFNGKQVKTKQKNNKKRKRSIY